MAAHVRIRVLMAVAVAVICGGVFVVTEGQRRADATSFEEYKAVQGLRSATMRMSLTVFVAADMGPRAAPMVHDAQVELDRVLSEMRSRSADRKPEHEAMLQQQAEAAVELARLASLAAGGRRDPQLKQAQGQAFDRFRGPNDALLAELADERAATRRAAARRPVVLVIVLCLVFGVLHLLLVERPAREERRRRRARQQFTSALQLARSEAEVSELLAGHIELVVHGARVTVLAADRQPRPGETIVPWIVSGEVVGAVLVEHEQPLDRRDLEVVTRSVGETAPVVANLRNLAIAEMRAATDALTGLPNQRTVHDTLRRECAQAGRSLTPLALVLFDLDHFKSINDTYGHHKGDEVLAAAAAAASGALRSSDFIGRFGGEEFAVILTDTGREGGVEAAEKVRMAIEAIEIPGIDRAITASFGVAVLPDDAGEPGDLFRMADLALYGAKHAGRNRVAVAANA